MLGCELGDPMVVIVVVMVTGVIVLVRVQSIAVAVHRSTRGSVGHGAGASPVGRRVPPGCE